MRVGLDGVSDIGISIVTGRDIRDSWHTFCVSGQWCAANVTYPKNETHEAGPLAPKFELIHGSLPSLFTYSWTQSGCLRNNWNTCE